MFWALDQLGTDAYVSFFHLGTERARSWESKSWMKCLTDRDGFVGVDNIGMVPLDGGMGMFGYDR